MFAVTEELEELVSTGFYVDGPTIALGSVLNYGRIVQVFSEGVILLDSGTTVVKCLFLEAKIVQMLPVEEIIVNATICDPYIVLMLTSGKQVLLKTSQISRDLEFQMLPFDSKVI